MLRLYFHMIGLFILICLHIRCQKIERDVIADRVNCMNRKLDPLKGTELYNNVMLHFKDTFDVLKNQPQNFGVPSKVTSRVDEVIYFNKDSSECLLIVLKIMAEDRYFGSARIIRGYKKYGEWKFSLGLELSFDDSYFEIFKESTFDNLSILAKYSLLMKGNKNKNECDIDYEYWFVKLKD